MKRTWLTAAAAVLMVAACSGTPTASPTAAPASAAPEPTATAAPVTAAPVTAAPETAAPVTAAPETAAPSTPASGNGSVLVGQKGTADDLTLTPEEQTAASAALAGKTVGIVATTMETEYHTLLNNTAKNALEAMGATVNICNSQTDADKALQCFEGFVQDGVAAIITTSSSATVGDAATTAINDGIIVVQVTGLDLGDTGAVGISVDNLTIGLQEGRSAGTFAAQTWPGEEVQTMILDYPDIPDLVARADAIQQGLTETNPNVNVVGRYLGGLAENAVASTETAFTAFPAIRLVTGINDGGDLGAYQYLDQAGKTADDVAIFGIDCDPAAVTLIDQGTMYRGCVDTNPAGTGTLAANAIAKLMAGADVPGSVEVPVSTYQGKVSVGNGAVALGQKGQGSDFELTPEEQTAASAALAGKTVGIVATTMETEYHTLLNNTAKNALEAMGATVNICNSQTDADKALQCFEGFVQDGVAAIITTSSSATVGDAATTAINDGIIVVQVTGLDLGDTGAVGISVDNLTIGLQEGRSAGTFAAQTWPGEEVQTMILDYPDIPDLVARADAIQQGLTETNPNVNVVGRYLGGLAENAVASTETAFTAFPAIRLVTGINDGGDLGAYQYLDQAGKTADDVAIFGIDCDPAAVTLIDQGTMYRGCVDTNPAGTGTLAANAIAKLMAGALVPNSLEVPVSTYMGQGQ